METTIQKWGNSLAVRLPKGVVAKLAFQEGSRVEVHEGAAGILISQAPQARRSLKTLVRMIRPTQLHDEIAWGDAHGNEVW